MSVGIRLLRQRPIDLGTPQGTQAGTYRSEPKTIDLHFLIRALVKYRASDLHLKADRPPLYRIDGKMRTSNMPSLNDPVIREMVLGLLSPREMDELEKSRQVDFSFEVESIGRFRCNLYFQLGQLSAAIRSIPFEIPPLDTLGIPAVMKDLLSKPRGLLLVTGATGMGKSTTLASMVQFLNQTQRLHVITLENPIEFVHRDEKSVITQREVGSDIPTMEAAIKGAMRQDPDVIVIGEMRDFATIQAALTAAETGHLVISTLHTRDAKGSIDRMVDIFPGDSKNQVRIQLASSLLAVFTQQLILRKIGTGRVLATEVMVKSPTIEHLILEGQLDKIPEVIESSEQYYHMQSLNMSLKKLVTENIISLEEALLASSNPEDLRLKLSGIRRQEGYTQVDLETVQLERRRKA